VPVLLGAAFSLDVPIVALHLTRPPVEIPDRQALGIPSHLAAARGAYVLRDYEPGLPAWRHRLPARHHADAERGEPAA
jgi:transketolase